MALASLILLVPSWTSGSFQICPPEGSSEDASLSSKASLGCQLDIPRKKEPQFSPSDGSASVVLIGDLWKKAQHTVGGPGLYKKKSG